MWPWSGKMEEMNKNCKESESEKVSGCNLGLERYVLKLFDKETNSRSREAECGWHIKNELNCLVNIRNWQQDKEWFADLFWSDEVLWSLPGLHKPIECEWNLISFGKWRRCFKQASCGVELGRGLQCKFEMNYCFEKEGEKKTRMLNNCHSSVFEEKFDGTDGSPWLVQWDQPWQGMNDFNYDFSCY